MLRLQTLIRILYGASVARDNRAAFFQGRQLVQNIFGDGMSAGVNSLNDNICYMEYTYGDMNRSNNRGVSWTDISPPNAGTSSAYCFVAPYNIAKSNPNVVYIGGTAIYKSTTGGGSWQAPRASVFGGNRLLSSGSFLYKHRYIICRVCAESAAAAEFSAVNGGVNWTNITGSLPNRYVTGLTVNPNNSKEVVATFGGFGTPHVYKSTDNGNNWLNISGNLPDLPHHTVVMELLYPQNIYVK